jgi:dTDP-4-dehydrorhamnose 3,5-epimerase
VTVRSPRTVETSWKEAFDAALAAREPVFVPARPHCDDRGWSLMNLFTGVLAPQGQINFSVQHAGTIKAWHRHRKQTDFWMCVGGHLKAGVHRPDDGATWAIVVGEMKPGVLIIPPTLWHGAATVGAAPAGLLYYVTHAYDPAHPDEERRAWDSIPGFPWQTQHR